ncbi:uncharacterized protein LOC142991664 [Genypterus blacodes]|uniref:uncharacterized protein LOC142991664 n=1 Tax=Genypterus blacodes TaxID=154954 RepID=UPI003F770B1F
MAESLVHLSSRRSYRSCIHVHVSLGCASSVVFLYKPLSISLGDLEGGRAAQPGLYRSTLSIRLSRRSHRDVTPAKTDEDYGKSKLTASIREKYNGQETGLNHRGGPLSKQRGQKVQQVAHSVNSDGGDADTHCCGPALGRVKGSSPANAKAGGRRRDAEETACPSPSSDTHRQHTGTDSRTQAGRASCEESRQESEASSAEVLKVADSPDGAPKTLSLKEALQLFRPDFINRSQGRVRRLEQRARKRRRRALHDSNPDLVQGLGDDGGKQRRKCTTPDPLSDNLFKPAERSISGREMQLRSRRMYYKLPEVTKKREQEQRRAESQSNRLRAEVFKKRLLEQILQR